jgi:hypothetical protein
MTPYYYEIYIKEDVTGYSIFFKSTQHATTKDEIIAIAEMLGELDQDDIRYCDYAQQITKEEYFRATK